jgi:hypothetical protein
MAMGFDGGQMNDLLAGYNWGISIPSGKISGRQNKGLLKR